MATRHKTSFFAMPEKNMRFVTLLMLVFVCLLAQGSYLSTALSENPVSDTESAVITAPSNLDTPEIIPANSEEEDKKKARVILASGMSSHQVRKRFGDADKEEHAKGSPLTLWRYGQSVIIFQNRRVSVWIDNGELGVRELVPKRSRQEVSGNEVFKRQGWKNVWRRREKTKNIKDGVLEELLDN